MTITGEQFKSLSQRLRYEAFSKFAMEIGKLNRYEDVGNTLTYSFKYMVSSRFARIIIHHEALTVNFIIEKGKGTFGQIPLSPFENQVLEKGISAEYDKEEVVKKVPFLNDSSISNKEQVNKIFFFPLKISDNQRLLIELVHPENKLYSETDIPLLRLIGEFLLAKISQIYLSEQLEDKNKILAGKNDELQQLNNEISSLNANLEEKVKERTKELARTNEELKTVFYRSSHDLKSPLTTLKGLMDLIVNTSPENDEVQLLVEKSTHTIDKMGKMFDKMSLISSVHQHLKTSEKVGIQSLMNELLEKYNQTISANDISILHRRENQLSTYYEKGLVSAILEVILENAIQFQKSRTVQKQIEIRYGVLQNEVFIDLADNGVGIENDVLSRIFEMYFRGSLQSKGHGLGLYVADKLSVIIGGRIICSTKIGEGSHFRIYLPK